ncbi:MAG: DUF58 domain-containing protein [Oscillospiraceae bacterium]
MRFLIMLILALAAAEIFFTLVTFAASPKDKAELSLDGGRLDIKIRRRGGLFCSYFLNICVKNVYTGEQVTVETGRIYPVKNGVSFSAALDDINCGVIRAEIASAKFSVCTIFFKKKTRLLAAAELLVMPEKAAQGEVFDVFGETGERAGKAASGEPDGAREYRSGDRFKDIHMKLSAKVGKYMVRERADGFDSCVRLEFKYEKTAEKAVLAAKRLLAAAEECLNRGYICEVVCGGEFGESVVISGQWDIEPAFKKIFTASERLSAVGEGEASGNS